MADLTNGIVERLITIRRVRVHTLRRSADPCRLGMDCLPTVGMYYLCPLQLLYVCTVE